MKTKQENKLFDDPDRPMTFKEKAIIGLIIGIPLWLTIILSVIGNIDEKRTREKFSNRPQKTWYEVLTPEERHKYGLDRMPTEDVTFTPRPDASERFERVLREGSKENKLIEKINKGDYKDYYDYHDGPEGNMGDIDYHDIEDYFGGGHD